MLTEYFGKEPDGITGEELRDYFLYRKNECQWAPDTMKIRYCGIRFFYGHVIRREWHIFSILKSEKEKRLPWSETPMAVDSVQGAMRQARISAGIHKRRVTIHTLRHSYATHLLESGVNIRVIQKYPGHSQLETTMIYLHLTQKGQEDAYSLISDMMKGFGRECDTGHIH
jgi:integrase